MKPNSLLLRLRLLRSMGLKGLMLRLKIGKITREIGKLVSAFGIKSSVAWYGAYWINPKHLICWVIVESDHDKARLECEESLPVQFRKVLDSCNYPEPARKFVHFGFESNETVNRDFDGNWYCRFQS